jgi:hypothetical protein
MLLAANPTYVPVTDSFTFYSTRVQYAPYAFMCTHTITPSPPFLVSYQLTYYRRSLYTTVSYSLQLNQSISNLTAVI